MEIRLQKIIANAGITSRRKAEQLILDGEVFLNGKKVTTLGVKADPNVDYIVVQGQKILPNVKKKTIAYALYKPKNCVTTLDDPQERDIIANYFPKDMSKKVRLFPVGRLDYDAEGLVILTNDGDFAQSVIHPAQHVWKTYFVKIKGIFDKKHIKEFYHGMVLEGKKRQSAKVKVLHNINDKTWLEVSLQEGVNRQIKKMFHKVGHRVIKIKRYSVGNIELGELASGESRLITKPELDDLLVLVRGK
ncbi:MAG: 23S rRNA pseudouridine2605 synthase [bacterium]|jgi:23S rRNA pseudouridine2605 synthase